MSDGAIPASTGSLLVFLSFQIACVHFRQVSFSSVSRPVSLHVWSVPTQGKHTLQLSSIALERAT